MSEQDIPEDYIVVHSGVTQDGIPFKLAFLRSAVTPELLHLYNPEM